MQQLKELTLLVQPGFSIGAEAAPEDELDLLQAIEAHLCTIAAKEHHQLVVLMHQTKVDSDKIRLKPEHPAYVVIAMLGRIQQALNNQYMQIDGAFVCDRDACKRYVVQMRQHLQTRGYILGAETTVTGMGETAAVNVPTVTQHVGLLIQSDQKSKVQLDFTNARKEKNRARWQPRGVQLNKAKAHYQYVEFVPLGTYTEA